MNKNPSYTVPRINTSCLSPAEMSCHYENQTMLTYMALNAYIYGYPLVLTDLTRRIMLASGMQLNRFLNEQTSPSPQFTTIVRPNVDTLYSMAWLDLADEPVVLSVPDTHNRYYLMELLETWTNVFASIGARTTGTKAGAFAITGPNWNDRLPDGIQRIDAPTNTVWIIGRTQTNGPQDYPAVQAIENKYALIPLSCWGKNMVQAKGESENKQLSINPVTQVANMNAPTFFQTMLRAMVLNPPWIEDPQMNKTLATLGLTANNPFDFTRLSPAKQHALDFAVVNGSKLIKAEAEAKFRRNNINGWTLFLKNMGFYGVDYWQRAMVAMMGIGANLPQDAIYASAFTDAAGIPLTGFNNYWLHFDQAQLPPVNAFWSITVYNDQGYLVGNPIGRYAIGPHLGYLNYSNDGSLDIFIGNMAPAPASALTPANWLPVPNGPFNLILRMYWPKNQVLNGEWHPPAIIRI